MTNRDELQIILETIALQRNQANDQLAQFNAKLLLANKQIKELQEQITMLEERLKLESAELPEDSGD